MFLIISNYVTKISLIVFFLIQYFCLVFFNSLVDINSKLWQLLWFFFLFIHIIIFILILVFITPGGGHFLVVISMFLALIFPVFIVEFFLKYFCYYTLYDNFLTLIYEGFFLFIDFLYYSMIVMLELFLNIFRIFLIFFLKNLFKNFFLYLIYYSLLL